jgi:hypothetical protein
MYLAALACDGHFDANAQRLPTVQRDTQEAKNMNGSGLTDQRRPKKTYTFETLNPGLRAHITPEVFLKIMVLRSRASVNVSLGRPIAHACLSHRSTRREHAVLSTFDPNVDANAGERW